MKRYELTYFVGPELQKEEIEEVHNKIKSFISEQGGTIEETKKPLRKKLGYPVKERKEVFVITVIFNLSPEKIKEFELKLKEEKGIIRHMIAVKKEIPLKKSVKEVDEKIDEILKS